MAEIENRVYEIKKNNGCMLAFACALIFFFGGIFLIAQLAWIDRGQNSFTEMLPWYILDLFILLFCFLIFKTDKVSLGVYPTHIKMGRSKIKWPKIKEILIYKSAKRIIVSNHIMSERELSLIDFACYHVSIIFLIISILGFLTGFKQIHFLDSKKEFEEIIPFIEYYCETFKIKLTNHE